MESGEWRVESGGDIIHGESFLLRELVSPLISRATSVVRYTQSAMLGGLSMYPSRSAIRTWVSTSFSDP